MKTLIIVSASLLMSSCIRSASQDDTSRRSSRMVSVTMKMPTKIGDKDITGKLNFYSLKVEKTGGDCAFTDINQSEKADSPEVKIQASLRQGCDYAISLAFGVSGGDDGWEKDKIYITNEAHDGLPANPAIVKQEDIAGKSSITVKTCVPLTKAGSSALGIAIVECPSVADESTTTTIEPQIPGGANSGLKLTTNPIAEIKSEATGQPVKLLVSANLQSMAAKTQYCALLHKVTTVSREVFYLTSSHKVEAQGQIIFNDSKSDLTADQSADKVESYKIFAKCFDNPLDGTPEAITRDCRGGSCSAIN